MKPRIAIIGAGISGLTLAQSLAPHATITVFEKARGVGGRMSTRYADPFYFDHGAQFFTARSEAFQAFLAPLMTAGVVAEWQGKLVTLAPEKKETKRLWFEPHYVTTPHMNSLCKHLATGYDVRLSTEIAPLGEKQPEGWVLHDKSGAPLGQFDWVISTAPPAQTANLFAQVLPAASHLPAVSMQGCYALMIGFHAPWHKQWIAAHIADSPLAWVAINSSKPGRHSASTSIVAHSSHAWADAHIDDDMEKAQAFLLSEFEAVTGIDCSRADYLSTHRWKYATLQAPSATNPVCDGAQQLAATGDWVSASRIEDAWLNAMALAADIRGQLGA